MIRIIRTNSENNDFICLVSQLDADLANRDGEEHSFYDRFNKIDKIKYAVVAYVNEYPVGCGALKEFEVNSMEVKRMFVTPEYRGKEVADKILSELENWAKELAFTRCVLETGKRQQEAVRFYQKNGYRPIPNYGQYAGIENSLCFEKEI